MPKVNKQTVTAIGALVVAGVKVANELWTEANKDGKVSDAAKAVGTKLQGTLSVRDPGQRIEKQLDVVEQHAREAQAEPGRADQAAEWLATAQRIRTKIPLVQVEKGRTKAKHLKQLQRRTADLLQQIIAEGF